MHSEVVMEVRASMIQKPYRPRGRIAKYWFFGAWTVTIANFLAMIAHDTMIGGDAFNGHIAKGHYYVCTKVRCIEVSQSTYEWSRLHGIVFLAVLGVCMLVSLIVVLDDHTKTT